MHPPKHSRPHPPLPLAEAIAARLSWLPTAGSTNDVLAELATGPDARGWPDLAVVATDDQVAGKGRLGRSWAAPAGGSLAISVLLRPTGPSGAPVPVERWGFLPVLSGIAMARVVGRLVAAASLRSSHAEHSGPVGLKWPNDVLIGDRKVSGILAELLPGAAGIVLGAGVNLTLSSDQLPVPTATSLALAGVSSVSTDAVLAGYLDDLTGLYRTWCAHDGDAEAAGLVAEAVRASVTLGRAVRVELPGGGVRTGTATALDAGGRLVVEPDDGAEPLVVAAGDVTHLRHEA
ncbi:biotin--[acetyl-CoA-carboxylase] ligase [Herbiconiux moechotypicola]|uniref:biotin--[biotin carboxyl-carrier protein] ligase n=1 Tax=Herbiconiux moechotypicola TaxID=637393 RepID=A0ABP5QUQ9_9MICO|nr:biotin--[acetyl-CoA-carboxylase] ligase [Herbiconiux moechotypicola]MCS5730980.1 biotin--[acetyl-CoA-carboxylase] ligase [Herbiconiux moechotypicola]